MSLADVVAAGPVLALALGGCAVLAADLVFRLGSRALSAIGAAGALAAAAATLVGVGPAGFGGAVQRDGIALAFATLIAVATAAAIALGADHLPRIGLPPAETVALVLFSAAGATLMAAGGDLLIVFLGLELLSLPLYALTGLARGSPNADEGALKYFLLGAASSAIFLYGVALLYAATGTIMISGLGTAGTEPLSLAGLALLLVGLAFKAALVPFHTWAPDAYESAPTTVTAFMAVVAKLGAFAALIRVLVATSGATALADWRATLAVLAVLTLVLANFAALGQRKLKRLLAYSSIAHAGYVVIAAAAGALGAPAVLFYLGVYAALTLGSFGVVSLLENDDPAVDELHGLAQRRPWLVVWLAVLLLGLTGLPPTAGFVAKVYVFQVAARTDLLWLVVVGVLTSVVGAAYYLKVLIACLTPGEGTATVRSPAGWGVVGAAALLVLVVGVLPGPLLDLVQRVTFF